MPGSEEFDALIELLATVDDGDDSNFHIVPEGSASSGLRDASGKLDYAKIRSLFSQRRSKRDGNHVPSSEPLHNEPEPEMKLPQVSMDLIATQEFIHVVCFRLWWKNRQLCQKARIYPSLYHSEGKQSPMKSKKFQRFIHCICPEMASEIDKAFQG